MNTISLTLTPIQIELLQKQYPHAILKKTPAYAYYQIALSDCTITAYQSGKVVFQGSGAMLHASGYTSTKAPTAISTSNLADTFPQAGSDEVGTGDYFGPITVCACIVEKEQVQWLKDLQINDSKQVKDDYIYQIGSMLMEKLTHSLLILDNQTYNRIHHEQNMVEIKAKLHNQAYVHLRKKANGLPSAIIIDQFVQAKTYYRYLSKEKEIVEPIHFETKAEHKYLAVASASIIARYAFLKALDQLCTDYNFAFLKGAGANVDENIREFLQTHSQKELYKVAKVHFKNTEKALKNDEY